MSTDISIPTSRCARRVIDLRLQDSNTAVGWMEDDFHHFGVSICFKDGMVTDIRMASPRYPWTTCPGAEQPLKELIGKPLIERASNIGQLLDMRLQCTHVFDLTGLTLAHAYARRPRIRYEAITSERPPAPDFSLSNPKVGKGISVLLRNGKLVSHFELDNHRITGPEKFAGHSLNTGFREWTESMDIEAAEHAFILRRAILVAGGRMVNHDNFENAAAMGMPALCHSFQPAQRNKAIRCKNTTYNYEHSSAPMLLNVEEVP